MFTLCMTCMLASQEHTCPYTQERSPHQHTATLTAAHTRSSCTIPCSFSKGQWVSSMDQPFCFVPHAPKVLFCLLNVPLVLPFYVPVLSDDHVKMKTREPLLQRGHG